MDYPSSRPLVRVLCLPDVDRAIGGVKQLYRHVEHLVQLGWDAAILTESPDFRPSWFHSSAPTLSLTASHKIGELSSNQTILVVPETYLGVTFNEFRGVNLSRLPRVVFNQNAYYSYSSSCTLSSLSQFYDSAEVLHVLSVSEDSSNFLSRNLGIPDHKLSRIVNAIEPHFIPAIDKRNSIHWMPRKNPDHVNAVLLGLQRANLVNSSNWHAEPLIDLSHNDVARYLNSARLFLSFGHPEGFGLPIAEAMASGCWVVGYSGGGGRELFRFGASSEIPFGDWSAFVNGIQTALTSFSKYPRETNLMLSRQSLAVRTLYSRKQEHLSIESAWQRIETSYSSWITSQ